MPEYSHRQAVISGNLFLVGRGIYPLGLDNLLGIPDAGKNILVFKPGILF
jgi:hypothetical protein